MKIRTLTLLVLILLAPATLLADVKFVKVGERIFIISAETPVSIEEITAQFIDLTVGPDPNPDPDDPDKPDPDPVPPDPTIPTDKFDNLGQKVFSWARQFKVPGTREAGVVYKQAAARLKSLDPNTFMSVDESQIFIKSELAKIKLKYDANEQYAKLGQLINNIWRQEMQASANRTRDNIAAFYAAVGNGLR